MGFSYYTSLLAASLLAVISGRMSLRLAMAINAIAYVLFNYRFLKLALQTLPRDYIGVKTMSRVKKLLSKYNHDNAAVSDVFEQLARKYGPQKAAFVDVETGREWTFGEVDELANRVANHFQKAGLKKGDVVAVFMHNSIDYVCLWLGLSKLGVVAALVNYNLREEALKYSISIANAKAIIVGSDLLRDLADAMSGDPGLENLLLYSYGAMLAGTDMQNHGLPVKSLMSEIATEPATKPQVDDKPTFTDVLFYIYTSGTTGMPKAAVIKHCRFMMMAIGAHHGVRLTEDDRIYVTLPLYHVAAGILGVGQTILHGCTCVIRKKFSAHNFWDDCKKYKCTASQYIGEICRYLLAQPPKPSDQQHKIRVMYGNGLRQQIWQQFVDRFGIKHIAEFYGATEGNASLLNMDSHVGACGFLPIYRVLQKIMPAILLKVDPDTGELIRNEKGLCVPCRPGECGEVVGRIVKGDFLKDFSGYVSGKDTNKKIIRDVFKHGDAVYSSGDILYMDEKGYVYFKDRTGDTFRWKGENVSTTEVEGVLHKAVGMNDAVVYGVEIPMNEGKAGMAAIVDERQQIDLEHLEHMLKEKLPPYARPVFLRFCKHVDKTGTYKLKKTDYQKTGFDPRQVNDDRLYYLNKSGHYEPLTYAIYDAIQQGKVSF